MYKINDGFVVLSETTRDGAKWVLIAPRHAKTGKARKTGHQLVNLTTGALYEA